MSDKLCECGCGKPVTKSGNRFISGHNRRNGDYWKLRIEPKLCECGCEQSVKPGNRFVDKRHANRKTPWEPEPESTLCLCGCGGYAKPGNKFIRGHNCKDIKHSDERCEKTSDAGIKYYSDIENRERQSANLQHQDYDNGEWTGYTNKARPHLVPYSQCIHLNEPFEGCHRHHLTKTIVICIPAELHNHIQHNLKTGWNMGEMNMLALQFINGCYND